MRIVDDLDQYRLARRERFERGAMWVALVCTLAALAALLWPFTAHAQLSVAGGSVEAPGQSLIAKLMQSAGGPLVDLLLFALTGLVALVGRLIHSKTDAGPNTGNLNKALGIAATYIESATKHLLEGLAPDIKAALQNDGVIDPAERAALVTRGIALLKLELPAWVQAVLGSGFGKGLDTLLAGKVASALDGHLTALAAGADGSKPSTAEVVSPAASAPRPK